MGSFMQEINSRFRVAFFGRGELGYRVLSQLLDTPTLTVSVIITCSHTTEVGQGEINFKGIAQKYNIPFYKTNNINKSAWIKILNDCQIDLAVALLWVNTIQAEVIQTSRHGFLNLHGGLLPKYRGNPCQTWAILNGEPYTGVTVHLMEPGKLDSGDIILQEKIPISEKSTVKELIDTISDRGVHLMLKAVELVRTGQANPQSQDESLALYCYPRLPRDGEIDWTKPSQEILTLIRAAGKPYSGAYSYFADMRDNNKIKKLTIWNAALEENTINFCAVPGHLIKVDNGLKRAIVCGDKKLLVLLDIDIDGNLVNPHDFFHTVRQRFGLDTGTLIKTINELRK